MPNQQEIEAVLPMMMRERRSNILFPLICVACVFIGAVVFTIMGISEGFRGPAMAALLIDIFLIPSVIICIKNTLTENEKVRRLREGNVLIAEAAVKDIGVKRMSRYSYLSYVDATYYEDGKMVTQSLGVSRRIKRKVKKGSQGIIIKYNSSDNKWLDNKLVFIPE